MRLLLPLLYFACPANSKIGTEEDGLLGDSDRPVWEPDPYTIDNSSSATTVAWTPPSEEESGGLRPQFYAVTIESEFGSTTSDSKNDN